MLSFYSRKDAYINFTFQFYFSQIMNLFNAKKIVYDIASSYSCWVIESSHCRHLMIFKALLNFIFVWRGCVLILNSKYRKWLPPTSICSSYSVFVAFWVVKIVYFWNNQYQPCGWFCHSFHTEFLIYNIFLYVMTRVG